MDIKAKGLIIIMIADSKPKAVGEKDRSGKIRVDLISPECIIGMGEVLTAALNNYSENSWQNIDNPIDTHYGALLRHLLKWRSGELDDDKTKLSHIKHILTNAMFLLHHEERFLRNRDE